MAGPWQPLPQTPITAVSDMYRNKALQAQTAALQKQTEQADAELKLEQDKYDLAADEYIAKVGTARALDESQRLIAITEAAKGTDDPLAYANLPENIPAWVDSLEDGEGKTRLLEKGKNKFQAPELKEMFTLAKIIVNKKFEADTIAKPTANMQVLDDLVAQGHITTKQRNQYLEDQQKKAGTIVGTTKLDPSQDPRTASQTGAAYQEHIDRDSASAEIIELISSGLPEVMSLPGAVGTRGKIGLGGAGLLSTIGQDELANVFAEMVSGVDQETIAAMQTRLQVIRGRIIPIVTGEQGARISETEREIASTAVGVIDNIKGPADLTRAYPLVIGAMRQLMQESWVSRFMIASQNPSIEYPFDFNDRDDILEWGEGMAAAGMDLKSTKQTLARLKRIQGAK